MVEERLDKELEVARALERDILGDRYPLPCGCLIQATCSFPNAPWFHSRAYYHVCALHLGTAFRNKNGKMPKSRDWEQTQLINSILNTWLTEQGERVSVMKMEKAVLDCLHLHLPSVYMEKWAGTYWQKHGLLSREGRHVIQHDGRIFDRP